MNYTEFKDYVVDHLWKRGDSVVIDRLDAIIATAESELNRTFKVEDRTALSVVQADNNLVPLPLDYREMRVLANQTCAEMKYVAPSKFYAAQWCRRGGAFYPEAYTIINSNIGLAGNITVTNYVDLTLVYYANIPKFQELDASWLCDDYLDVYLYCVLKHTAPFLREDERIPTWMTFYTEAFSTAMDENDARKFAGSPLAISFPKNVR